MIDATFTYHDATNKNSTLISQIIQRVRYTHQQPGSPDIKEETLMNLTSTQLRSRLNNDIDSEKTLRHDELAGAELWTLPPSHPLALAPLPPDNAIYNGEEETPEDGSTPIIRASSVIAVRSNLVITHINIMNYSFQCWHSHVTVLRRIAESQDEIALILEDDVDMEWDFERRMRYLLQFLPPNKWDQLMLGTLLHYIPDNQF